MSTFVLLPGAGSTSWYWHLVEPELRAAGHDVVAVDLPVDDDSCGLAEYRSVALAAIGDRRDLVVVGQSMGAYTAGLLADAVPVERIVLVAPMTPAPGESPGDWWDNTGQPAAMRDLAIRQGRDPDAEFDPVAVFLHDVPDALVAESGAHVRAQSQTPFAKPWPLDAWPAVPTNFLLGRDDRFFPAEFQRRVAAERLGIEADEIDGGHLPALSRPRVLASRLLGYEAER